MSGGLKKSIYFYKTKSIINKIMKLNCVVVDDSSHREDDYRKVSK